MREHEHEVVREQAAWSIERLAHREYGS
jgi:hypothetical protein